MLLLNYEGSAPVKLSEREGEKKAGKVEEKEHGSVVFVKAKCDRAMKRNETDVFITIARHAACMNA
jgi:hypothetical protein